MDRNPYIYTQTDIVKQTRSNSIIHWRVHLEREFPNFDWHWEIKFINFTNTHLTWKKISQIRLVLRNKIYRFHKYTSYLLLTYIKKYKWRKAVWGNDNNMQDLTEQREGGQPAQPVTITVTVTVYRAPHPTLDSSPVLPILLKTPVQPCPVLPSPTRAATGWHRLTDFRRRV